MATSLTGIGIVWATLSLAAALLCCTGFYLPFWIQGRLLGRVDAYFSSFRRCNYPRVNPQGVVEIVEECGRYSRFWDIPSPWWQASTVLVGTGSALSLLIAVTATAACCITYVIHSGNAKIAGSAQLLSGKITFCPTGRRRCGGLSRRMGQQRSAGVLREHQPYIQTRYLPTFLVHLLALIRSTSTSHMFLFKFLRISGSCEIGVIISQNYNKDVLVYRNYSEPRLSGSKNEFLEGGEGRLVSDLSVQRRHVTEQRVALRLAHPVLPLSTLATTTTTTNCVEAERPGTSKTVIRAEIANVPLSPALGVANISDAVKSLPKCLMHSDGNVFD